MTKTDRIEELLKKYDEHGFPRKNYIENNFIKDLLICLNPNEQKKVEKEISLENIENSADFIVASSSLVSSESLENLFYKNINDEKIEVKLLNTEGKSKKYIIYQSGDEVIKINKDAFQLCDYKTRTENNFSALFSSSAYDQIKDTQEKKLESIVEYIPKSRGSILDFGCGVGFSTIPLARRFPNKKITATDFSDDAIRLLKKSAIEIENIDAYEEDSESLHLRFKEKSFGTSVGINAIEETLPWKVFYSLKKVTNGPMIVVQDAFDYSQIQKWSGWYGLKIKNSFSIDTPESEKGENEAYVISV